MTTASEDTPIKPWHAVRRSKLHGNGVFAARKIPRARIIEYGGQRISAKEADRRHPTNPDDPFHTFFFALSSGRVIDGGDEGNDARWINHSCEPNCEAQEGKHGKRVYIVAVRDIARGEELSYDYGLVLDGRITKALRDGYRCLCGTPPCRGTMLALSDKQKKKAQKKLAEARQAEAQPVAKSADAPTKNGRFEASGEAGRQTGRTVGRKAGRQTRSQAGRARASERPGRHQAGAETRPQAGRSHCPAGSSPVQGPAAKRRATHKTAPVPSPPETPPAAGVLPVPPRQAYNQPVVNTTCSTSSGRGEIPHRRYATQCGEPASARCSPGTPGSADLVRCQGRRS